MKKLLAFVLTIALVLTFAACGSSQEAPAPQDGGAATEAPAATSAPAATAAPSADSSVQDVFHPAASADTGAYVTISVSKDLPMADSSAWLGLCPAGKDYITELEADEADVIWFYADDREEGDPYVYACDFSSVEDGTYALVVCTSDDEAVGYVVLQCEMTKDGETLSFDYSNAKLNEKP